MNSKLISFEGIDGSGKSTQIKLLCKWLENKDIDYLVVREPGGTLISEQIREILLNKKNSNISMETEVFLFLSARAQLIHQIISPALSSNKYVICDRFIHSTIAYQGHGRGLNLELLNQMNLMALNDTLLQHTFLLDLDVETSTLRRKGNDSDRMESSGIDFMNNVRKGYLELSELYDDKITLINAQYDKFDIFDSIKTKLCSIYGELND